MVNLDYNNNLMAKIELKAGKMLIKKGLTLAIAESCTGGLLSNLVTNISGSSKYFILGTITYSNKTKISILKIPKYILDRHGAVSRPAARLMASSVKRLAHADCGIGISGIAGPSGGSYQKPVGTVFIAIDAPDKKICERFYFKGTRLTIKKKAALKALKLLRRCLEIN